jgi:glycosyltransferase involved in cell wall biosynthesis
MYLHHAIAVVVPAHNEESLIVSTIRSIPDFVDRIIVVDDGSSDQTLQSVIQVDDARIFLIKHAENRGVGAATISGYQAALRLNIDIVVVMDGDGQMHPSDLI